MSDKIAVLEISSWMGISIGAEHYYGALWIHEERIEFKHRLTKVEVDERNTKDSTFRWRVGNSVSGFTTEKEIRLLAIEMCKKDPKVKLLLEGRYAIADVQIAIYGDPEVIGKISKLYKRADVIDFWDHKKHEDEMRDIDNKFDELLKELK